MVKSRGTVPAAKLDDADALAGAVGALRKVVDPRHVDAANNRWSRGSAGPCPLRSLVPPLSPAHLEMRPGERSIIESEHALDHSAYSAGTCTGPVRPR